MAKVGASKNLNIATKVAWFHIIWILILALSSIRLPIGRSILGDRKHCTNQCTNRHCMQSYQAFDIAYV